LRGPVPTIEVDRRSSPTRPATAVWLPCRRAASRLRSSMFFTERPC